jgi:hypothetical protein
MPERESFVGRTAGGMLSNALYDVLRGLLGGSVITFGAVIWQYLKHRPVDWWGMIALGAFVAVVLELLARFHKRPDRAPLPAPQESSCAPWKTKEHWRLMYETEQEEKLKRQELHDEEIRKLEAIRDELEAENRGALEKLGDLEGLVNPLQVELLAVICETKELLDEVGEIPVHVPSDGFAGFASWNQELASWQSKTDARFRLNLASKVDRIRLKIAASEIKKSTQAEADLWTLDVLTKKPVETHDDLIKVVESLERLFFVVGTV